MGTNSTATNASDATPAAELWELCGESVGLFTTYTGDHQPTGEEHKFLQVLEEDRGGTIADIVPADLRVRISKSDPADVGDCFRSSGRWIVSDAFKALVERFGIPNTEFFPMKVVTIASGYVYGERWKDGVTLGHYWLMNCWNRIDAASHVDFETSNLRWQKSFTGHRPPWFSLWWNLVLKAPIEADLYGFADHMPRHRYVSTRFRDAAAEAGLRAGIFVRPLSPRPDHPRSPDPL